MSWGFRWGWFRLLGPQGPVDREDDASRRGAHTSHPQCDKVSLSILILKTLSSHCYWKMNYVGSGGYHC